jgi:hypothetical protein
MPYVLTHLLVAYEVDSGGCGLFYVGSIAPDYAGDRERKDSIHLRGVQDRLLPQERWRALEQLRDGSDMSSPFDAGWILHLFVDLVWEETAVDEFRKTCADDGWYLKYREEMNMLSFHMYHNAPWTAEIFGKIAAADLTAVKTSLPITQEENEWWRDRTVKKHAESDRTTPESAVFTDEMINRFAKQTAERYKAWITS